MSHYKIKIKPSSKIKSKDLIKRLLICCTKKINYDIDFSCSSKDNPENIWCIDFIPFHHVINLIKDLIDHEIIDSIDSIISVKEYYRNTIEHDIEEFKKMILPELQILEALEI